MNHARGAFVATILVFGLAVVATRGNAASSVGPISETLTGTASVTGARWSRQPIDVAGPGTITASLSWTDASTNLNLFLKDPAGNVVAESRAHTGTSESITYTATKAGTWKFGIKAVTGGSDYTLLVTYPGDVVATGSDGGGGSTGDSGSAGSTGVDTTGGGTTADTGGTTGGSTGGGTTGGDGAGGTSDGGQPAGSPTLELWSAKFMNGSSSVTLDQAVAEAQRFDVISATRNVYRPYVAQMKAANPNLTLLVYLNGTYAQQNQGSAFPDSWYSHTALGAKITSHGWGNYLMNPASQGWVDHVVQSCLSFKADSGYDGCLLDMLGTGPLLPRYGTGLPVNPATGEVWTPDQWLQATSHLAEQVKAALGSAPLGGNGIQNGWSYFRPTAPSAQLFGGLDYGMAETWVRSAGQGIDQWAPEQRWQANVDALADAGSRGESILAITKCWTDGTAAQKEQWHRFALASFLLGNDGHSRFYFSYSASNDAADDNAMWHVKLGQPQSAYTQAGGVYQRTFAAGKVLVNPGDTSVTVPLGSTYTDLDGQTVSSVTMAPHTGQILTD
ncbi:MAG TPA: putative glycoside hydrolase [Gaiellales bacterium]|jgi:hypothetical protein|nr:putative glycoside hydrolase [Gaiellales bacterium]